MRKYFFLMIAIVAIAALALLAANHFGKSDSNPTPTPTLLVVPTATPTPMPTATPMPTEADRWSEVQLCAPVAFLVNIYNGNLHGLDLFLANRGSFEPTSNWRMEYNPNRYEVWGLYKLNNEGRNVPTSDRWGHPIFETTYVQSLNEVPLGETVAYNRNGLIARSARSSDGSAMLKVEEPVLCDVDLLMEPSWSDPMSMTKTITSSIQVGSWGFTSEFYVADGELAPGMYRHIYRRALTGDGFSNWYRIGFVGGGTSSQNYGISQDGEVSWLVYGGDRPNVTEPHSVGVLPLHKEIIVCTTFFRDGIEGPTGQEEQRFILWDDGLGPRMLEQKNPKGACEFLTDK